MTISDIISKLLSIFQWWVVVQPWEQGLRVRLGKRITKMEPGIWLRVPGIDAVYIHAIRLRTLDLGVQTMTTSDGYTCTAAGTLRYDVDDLLKVFETLHRVEETLVDLAAAAIAQHISTNAKTAITPASAAAAAMDAIDFESYGLSAAGVSITDFAFVRTYRLIQSDRKEVWGGDIDTRNENWRKE